MVCLTGVYCLSGFRSPLLYNCSANMPSVLEADALSGRSGEDAKKHGQTRRQRKQTDEKIESVCWICSEGFLQQAHIDPLKTLKGIIQTL